MNLEQRKTFRIQIPEGRERGTLFLHKVPVEVRILDESAGGFAVALLTDADVQQNQVHVLKTATGMYETRVARIEHFDDGQLLGLMRLHDVAESPEQQLRAEWQDRHPHPLETPSRSGFATGMAAAALVGALFCGLAWYCLRNSPVRRAAATAVPESALVAARQEAEEPTAPVEETPAEAKNTEPSVTPQTPVPGKRTSPAAKPRKASRVSPEVLYRLELDSDQSRRIRDILSRASGNTAAAEQEILSLLSPEQASRWQTLAP